VRFATDKITHGYLPAYLRIAAALGPQALVCEVGVQDGHGLDMLQALFPDGIVAGVDSNPGSTWPDGTMRIVCNQADPALPARLARVSPQWNLIVDDASHDGKLTAVTFGLLWPLVAPGGFYVVEDWMVALPGWPAYDASMLATVAGFLPMLTAGSEIADITYSYGLCVLRRKG
jgi:hypothetical protein